jgi:hypothetical protein
MYLLFENRVFVLIYVYSRVSSTKQIEGLSLSLQGDQTLLDEVAAKFKTTVSDRIYQDAGVSAHTDANLNADLGVLLEDIDKKIIKPQDIIVMRHLDRLSRLAVMKAMQVFTKIMDSGVRIYTTMDSQEYSNNDSNARTSLLLATLSFALANEESVKKSYYTNKNALARIDQFNKDERTANGFPFDIGVGGTPLHCTVVDKAVQRNPEKYEAVKALVKFALAGNGIGKCRDWLHDNHGVDYTKQGVGNLLKSPSLYGKLIVKIQDRDAIAMHRHTKNEEKHITKVYELDAYFPAVCTEDEYYLLQSMRKKSVSSGNKKSYTLLAGRKILHCGECKSSLTANHSSGKGAVYYTCINQKCLLTEKIYTINKMVVEAISSVGINSFDVDTSRLDVLVSKQEKLNDKFNTGQKLVFDNPESFGDYMGDQLSKLNHEIKDIGYEIESENRSIQSNKMIELSDYEKAVEMIHGYQDEMMSDDSELIKSNGDSIARFIKDLLIYRSGLIHIEMVTGKNVYFYIPNQNKSKGRRLALKLMVVENDDVNYVNYKSDPSLNRKVFTEDQISNNEFECEVYDIDQTLLRLYSEEHTRHNALESFVNTILSCCGNGYAIYRKKNFVGGEIFTDKQWQTNKTRAKNILEGRGLMYDVAYVTLKGTQTMTSVVSRNDMKNQMENLQVSLNAKEIKNVSLAIRKK